MPISRASLDFSGVAIIVVVVIILAIIAFCVWRIPSMNARRERKETDGRRDRLRVSGVFTAGVTPAGMALAPNGCLYIANNNDYGIPGSDSVTVWNTKTNTYETTIYDASFDGPYTITAVETLLYVTNSNGVTITVIDSATNTVVGVISGFDGPSGMVTFAGFGYVNNYGSSGGVGSGNGMTVSVFNLRTRLITATITVGLAPSALAVHPHYPLLYVLNYVDGNVGTGTISVVSLQTKIVILTIPGLFGPFDLAFTPDGRALFVTNFGSNNFAPYGTTVSEINAESNSIVRTIPTGGIQPSGIAMSPDGEVVYVSNYNTLYGDAMTFSDLTAGEGTIVALPVHPTRHKMAMFTVGVGQSPNKLVVDPHTGRVFCSNYTSNSVTCLD